MATIGQYPLIIRGSAAGVTQASTIMSLVVPQGSFSLDLSPIIVYGFIDPVQKVGPTARIDVTVSRENGVRGAVTLEALGLPNDVELGFVRSIDSNSTTEGLYLLVGPTAPAGSYPITIRATGADVEPRSATVNVVVAAQ